MSVHIVIGAQYGGEGKGKVCSFFGRKANLTVCSGGPNSAHVIQRNGKRYVLRCVPSSIFSSKGIFAIGPAGIIDLEILKNELEDLEIDNSKMKIDPQALTLENRHRKARKHAWEDRLSTGVGVGAVVAEHVIRHKSLKRAQDIKELAPFLTDVPDLINEFDTKGKNVLIQGSQGFGLSLYHGDYPYVTNRDTSAAAICSHSGIAIGRVSSVTLVVRTFPIRSLSGLLRNEITWDEVTKRAKSKTPITEYTSFANIVRRVANFDISLFKRACLINGPTQIAVNFIDHLCFEDRDKTEYENLSSISKTFIKMLESISGNQVKFVGTGPEEESYIWRS